MNNCALCYVYVQFSMFQEASAFNKDIGSWDVSRGTNFVSIAVNGIIFVILDPS